jgi:hypothetical protein
MERRANLRMKPSCPARVHPCVEVPIHQVQHLSFTKPKSILNNQSRFPVWITKAITKVLSDRRRQNTITPMHGGTHALTYQVTRMRAMMSPSLIKEDKWGTFGSRFKNMLESPLYAR